MSGEERETIRRIRDELWPEFFEQFVRHNAEYPEERPLGARAEWHGIHRKVGKLQSPVWEGKEWTGREPVRQMFQEIIGHAFLAILSLDDEEEGKTSANAVQGGTVDQEVIPDGTIYDQEFHKFIGTGENCTGLKGHRNGPLCGWSRDAKVHRVPS